MNIHIHFRKINCKTEGECQTIQVAYHTQIVYKNAGSNVQSPWKCICRVLKCIKKHMFMRLVHEPYLSLAAWERVGE